MSTPPTEFARRIGEHPMDEGQEAVLARVLAEVSCAGERTPTPGERAFISEFAPRCETPLETLAEDSLDHAGLDDLDPEMARTMMMIAQAVTLLDGPRESRQLMALVRLASRMGLSPDQAEAMDAAAREFHAERHLRELYAVGKPSASERADALVHLAQLGVDDETVRRWEAAARASAPTATPAASQRAMDGRHTAFRDRRRNRLMRRHDPRSDRHRNSRGPSVFGAS